MSKNLSEVIAETIEDEAADFNVLFEGAGGPVTVGDLREWVGQAEQLARLAERGMTMDITIKQIDGVPELPYGYRVSTADKSIVAHGISAEVALIRGLSMIGFRELGRLRQKAERGERLLREAQEMQGQYAQTAEGSRLDGTRTEDMTYEQGGADALEKVIAAALAETREDSREKREDDMAADLSAWDDVLGCEWAEAVQAVCDGDDTALFLLVHALWQKAERAEKTDRLIEALGMFSENMQRQHSGLAMAYADEVFFGLIPDLAADAAEAIALDEGNEPDATSQAEAEQQAAEDEEGMAHDHFREGVDDEIAREKGTS